MKLNDNFTLDRYGLHVRLVNEDDANFILELRTNPKLTPFLNSTANDVEKQREWIKQYKLREERGEDYYFIYYFENEPIGVNRIYDIESTYGTSGSWICKPDLPFEIPILTLIIERENAFEILKLSYDKFYVRKKNFQVLRIHTLCGAEKVAESDLDYSLELSSDSFQKKRGYLLNLLNLEK